MPADEPSRTRIARTLGFRDRPPARALDQLDAELAPPPGAPCARIHERLYFRPLLEAFAGADAELLAKPGAVEARLERLRLLRRRPRPRAAVRRADPGPHPARRA